MKDKFMGTVNVHGGEPVPEEKMLFSPEPDAKRTLQVLCGGRVCCYVTGGEAAVITVFLQRGMKLYCVRGEDEEKEKGVQHTVKVYYTPEKI